MKRYLVEKKELEHLAARVAEYRSQLHERDRLRGEVARLQKRMALLAALVRLEGQECCLPWE
jgi:hypothetical protein